MTERDVHYRHGKRPSRDEVRELRDVIREHIDWLQSVKPLKIKRVALLEGRRAGIPGTIIRTSKLPNCFGQEMVFHAVELDDNHGVIVAMPHKLRAITA